MPIVNIKLIENVFNPAQKQEMIEKITETMVDIEGENLRSVTWVFIEEVKEGSFAIGGQTLHARDVHKLQAGESAA